MGKGAAIPYIEISCYLISHNLEQDEGKNAVQEANGNESILVSQEENALPADNATDSQL